MTSTFTDRTKAMVARCQHEYRWQIRWVKDTCAETRTVLAEGILVDDGADGADVADVARVTVFERLPERGGICGQIIDTNGRLTLIEWPDRISIEVFDDFYEALDAYPAHRFDFDTWFRGPHGARETDG